MTNSDPETVSFLRVFVAFAVVFGLLGLFGFALKHVKMRGLTMPGRMPRAGRLQVVEALNIDPRRRLVIIRRDDTEHLLLLGVNQDIIVETHMSTNPADTLRTRGTL